jgi:catechol 2,3-dioxygenase
MATDPLDVLSVIASAQGRPWDGAPAGTQMGHVHLHVGSLDTAEAFYHRAIGFDKTVWSYPGALFMSAAGYHHHLATNMWSQGPSPAPDQAQLLEWELVVPGRADPASVGQSLRACGYPTEHDAHGFVTVDHWHTAMRVLAGG